MPALEITNLTFRYSARSDLVLEIPDFRVQRGEKIFLQGPSGSGKTTLLSLIGGLFSPSSGDVSVLETSLGKLTPLQTDKFRAQNIGFIFQVFNLVPYLSVLENVILPCQFGRQKSKEFASPRDEAAYLLSRLKLADQQNADVTKLSIGQQQRVAAARALIGSPGLIIADEPTSALDADTRFDFLRILFDQAKREASSILFVSHDQSLSPEFDRSVALADINVVAKGPARGSI